MKYLKLYENFENTELLCQKYFKERNYTINQDGSVDINGGVDLDYYYLDNIPLNFNRVSGYFDISNNRISSLKGIPKYIGDGLFISSNRIKTLGNYLSHFEEISGGFYCMGNELTSLDGCPKRIIDGFDCSSNKLINLKSCPEYIGGEFDFELNMINTLTYFPKTIIGNGIEGTHNKITNLMGLPIKFDRIYLYGNPIYEILFIVDEDIYGKIGRQKFIKFLIEYDVIRENNIIIEQRLEEAYYMATKKELPRNKRRFKNYKLI